MEPVSGDEIGKTSDGLNVINDCVQCNAYSFKCFVEESTDGPLPDPFGMMP